MSSRDRGDFCTLIHKALRAGLLAVDIEAGRLDWCDGSEVQAFTRRWDQIVTLIRSHARHEDRHVWPLLESKQPGSVAELGIGHDPIDAEMDAADALLRTELGEPTPSAGLTFYRALNRLVAHTLDHFSAEEPAVMEMLWAQCTDDELAACSQSGSPASSATCQRTPSCSCDACSTSPHRSADRNPASHVTLARKRRAPTRRRAV